MAEENTIHKSKTYLEVHVLDTSGEQHTEYYNTMRVQKKSKKIGCDKLFFEAIKRFVDEHGHFMHSSTIVITANSDRPQPKKNQRWARKPEMHQPKKNNQYYIESNNHV